MDYKKMSESELANAIVSKYGSGDFQQILISHSDDEMVVELLEKMSHASN